LAAHYGGRAGPDNKLALMKWTTGRIGVPLLLESLAWFECQVVGVNIRPGTTCWW